MAIRVDESSHIDLSDDPAFFIWLQTFSFLCWVAVNEPKASIAITWVCSSTGFLTTVV